MARFEVVVLGASAGGFEAFRFLLSRLPSDFPLPLLLVLHLHPESRSFVADSINEQCRITVKEADEKEKIKSGTAYFAPAGYHLLIEDDRTFSLSVDEKVSWARPSVDVLFESAAAVYRGKVIGILLTGGNADGVNGLTVIKKMGGLAVAQDPREASVDAMPRAAISAGAVDHILTLEGIVSLLLKL